MIYFYKDLTNDPPTQLIPIDHQYGDRFDFLKKIHPDKKNEINEKIKSEPYLIADIAASVVSQFRDSDYLKLKKVARKGLFCCQDLMSNKGYELTYLSKLLEKQINKNKELHVLVAGCQSRRTQRARVGALVKFVSSYSYPCRIVFSGKNPGTDFVRTCNEAVEMERIFRHDMENLSPKKQSFSTLRYELDEEAHNTIENIEKYIKAIDIDADIDTIVIVSSTFHLLRLSDAVEIILESTPLKNKITKLIFIGSEDPENPELDSIHPQYIKWMYFDIFRIIFELSATHQSV